MKHLLSKRTLCLLAAASLSLGLALPVQATESSATMFTPKEHAQVSYEQMAEEFARSSKDSQALDQALRDLARYTGLEGREEEVQEACSRVLREIDRLNTWITLADIEYSRDMGSQQASRQYEELGNLYPEAANRAVLGLQAALKSPYRSVMEETLGRDWTEMIQNYQAMTQEELDLNAREQALIQDYELAAAQAVEAEVQGEIWTYERLDQEMTPPYSQEYYDIMRALDREKNQTLGEIYLDLVQVRDEIAGLYGYDSYGDYAYEMIYSRDYTPEDTQAVRTVIKEQIVPLMTDSWNTEADFQALDALQPENAAQMLDLLQPWIGQIDQDLERSFSYMRQYDLYDIQAQQDDQSRSGGYTSALPYYGDAYIFLTLTGTYQDYVDLFHEFGHFNAVFHENVPSLFQTYNVDVSEVHSQGLQMLLMHYAEDMFGQAGTAMEADMVSDMLDSIVIGSMINEFECQVYENPDMTLEEMNRLFQQIDQSYGSWYFDYDGEYCYGWSSIPHVFSTPLYYIGYASSAYPALELWLQSKTDWQGAVDQYMELTAMGNWIPYRAAMDQAGMKDMFDQGALEEMAEAVYGQLFSQEADTPAWEIEGQIQPESIFQGNTGTILVILLCMGVLILVLQALLILLAGVVIVLLLKNQKKN